ncbi:MAG: hypothetical protein ACI80S_000921 [Pseudohongiellaceae bacterium]|jgi:hypothetical protein
MKKLSKEQVSTMTLKEVVADYCRIKNGVDDADIAETLAFINKLLPIDEFLSSSEASEQTLSLDKKE